MLRTLLNLEGPAFTRVAPALFAYLFNRIDMEGFIAHVGDRKLGTTIKDIARGNGYILKNCKLYAYACYYARSQGEALPRPSKYGVTARDAQMLKRLNLRHLDLKLYKAFTLEEFDATVEAMVTSSEIKNYVGKFVTKKMTFLIGSYGDGRADLESFLKEQAVIAVYKQYPRYESHLHFINVAKAQIHNKGHSYITSSTSQSRQKLMKDEHGLHQAVHVPIDALNDLTSPNYGEELREKLTALAQLEHRMTEKTKSFLLCAAGQYHDGFSAFLQCSNSEAAESMDYGRYMVKVQTYFNVTPEDTQRLFSRLKASVYRCKLLQEGMNAFSKAVKA